jgi:hypothetical protein
MVLYVHIFDVLKIKVIRLIIEVVSSAALNSISIIDHSGFLEDANNHSIAFCAYLNGPFNI